MEDSWSMFEHDPNAQYPVVMRKLKHCNHQQAMFHCSAEVSTYITHVTTLDGLPHGVAWQIPYVIFPKQCEFSIETQGLFTIHGSFRILYTWGGDGGRVILVDTRCWHDMMNYTVMWSLTERAYFLDTKKIFQRF